ncbi:SHOCT domain-containing protein [Cellulomonas taurus]|uniref:SHOCT domain-containing protein n=1 Tax=Cellulomonas taurus TaxID=2729175 RepID=UPI00145CE18F|nr:SHOCT domain-containing protein [Cellulomonas taurus]
MSDSPTAGPSPAGALLGVAAAALGGWLLHLGARDASLVRWECAVSTCGTDDLAGAAPVLGILALVVAAGLLTRTLRTVAPPLLMLVGAGAALLGWRDAVDQGLVTAASVQSWQMVVGLVAAVALVVTVLTAIRELRRSSGYWVLLGRRGTWGRVTDYASDGTATVHFDDADGNRYSVRTSVPRDAFKRAPRVYYDPVAPTDVGRLRVGLPGQPLTATARRDQFDAVRRLLPLPDDDLRSDATAAMDIAPDGTRTTTTTGAYGTRRTTVAPDGTRTTTTIAPDGNTTTRSSTVRSSTTRSSSTRSSTETVTDVSVALERLSALHREGALSDQEFAAAKAAVLRR